MSTVRAVDLFCGAGGTSTGLARACKRLRRPVELVAVNHWATAVETHAAAHPWAVHHCASLEDLRPKKAVPSGRLDLLVASPECTHHSIARGGKPMNDQSRASAWAVLRWAEELNVKEILVENVKEFAKWGPLDRKGKRIERREGETFKAWLNALDSLGYNIEWDILNAADYGDPTTRERLFVRASKGKVRWPEPSHAEDGEDGLIPWVPASEIIDWEIEGKSIFGRDRPLCANTIERIRQGLKKFGGLDFVITPGGANLRGGRSTKKPLPTVTCSDRFAVVEPFLMHVTHHGKRKVHSLRRPVPTITGAHRGEMAFIVPQFSSNKPRSVKRPLGVVTTTSRGMGLCEPFILPHRQFKQMDVDSIRKPLRTVTAANGDDNALVEPIIIQYNRTGGPHSVRRPLPTVTTKDRFGLVTVYELDIRFRMLQPRELAAAMGFPKDYPFAGNREDQVKQIGNAVAVNMAEALCRAALRRTA